MRRRDRDEAETQRVLGSLCGTKPINYQLSSPTGMLTIPYGLSSAQFAEIQRAFDLHKKMLPGGSKSW